MRASKQQIGRMVDRLGHKRQRLHDLLAECDMIALTIKKAGGGEGERFVARLLRMPKKVMVVRAHTQVRTYARAH